MTTHIKEETLQVVAAENLQGSVFKVLSINGTIAQTVREAIGISKTSTSSGQHATAIYQGLTKAYFGGAVATPGWPLTITTSGFVIAAGSGNSTCGRLGATAVLSGQIGFALFDFNNLGYNPG
jgi:hypothetical protein